VKTREVNTYPLVIFRNLFSYADDFACSLSESQTDSWYNETTHRWLVDDDVLAELDNDVQAVINCTSENDTVMFRSESTLKPRNTITIPWNLTLSGYLQGNLMTRGRISKAGNKVRLTCARNGPLIVARYGGF